MLTINSKLKPQNSSDLFDTSYLTADLKGRSVRGGAITVVSQACKFILQTGSTVVLARLLTPADFGLIAMVTAITGFATIFADLGLSMATVQKAKINHDQVSTLFWINVALGLLLAVIIVALAPAIAWFYGDARLTAVTAALGIVYVFSGLTVQHQAMLRRHMRFFSLYVIQITSLAIGVVAAVLAALLGASYWALVIQGVLASLTLAVGVWIASRWVPGRPKRGIGNRRMLSFGGNIAGSSIVRYISEHADKILIGKFVGSSALGLYSKAYGLLMLPTNQLQTPLFSVGLPGLCRLQDNPERLRNYYLKMLQLLAFFIVPMALFLGGVAYEVIMLVLGPQWEPAVSVYRILSLVAVVQPLRDTDKMVMIAKGNANRYLKLNLLSSVVLVSSFIVGLPWGIHGVAISYTVANYLLLLPRLAYAFSKTPIRVRDFFGAILIPICAGVIMLCGSRLVFYYCKDLPDFMALGIALIAAGVFYYASYFVLPTGKTVLEDMKISAKLLTQVD